LVVVLIAQRSEKELVNSRVGMLPDVFGITDSRSESKKGRSKPGVGWRLTSGEFGDDRRMFIEWRGQSAVVCNQQGAE